MAAILRVILWAFERWWRASILLSVFIAQIFQRSWGGPFSVDGRLPIATTEWVLIFFVFQAKIKQDRINRLTEFIDPHMSQTKYAKWNNFKTQQWDSYSQPFLTQGLQSKCAKSMPPRELSRSFKEKRLLLHYDIETSTRYPISRNIYLLQHLAIQNSTLDIVNFILSFRYQWQS